MATPDATVAVIVSTYNRASLVVQTLDSVAGQSRPADKVIVVDDGSTDNTAETIQSRFPRAEYLYQSNSGKSAALNRALSVANTDYIWIIDDDDLMHPTALERHLAFLADHPYADFSYASHYLFEGDRRPPSIDRLPLCDCSGVDPSALLIRCLETFTFSMSSMLVPITCYRRAGPFNEALKRGQDYEMILRLARLFRGGYVPQPPLLVRRHSGERGPATERHAALSRDVIWRKYEKEIFLNVYETLPLHAYLPVGSGADDLAPHRNRRALLQRACVMARHGLFDFTLRDIQLAVAQPVADASLTASERMICARMLNVEPAVLRGQSTFLASIRRLSRRRLPGLRERCMVGLYWSMRRELVEGRYGGAVQIASHLTRLAGPAAAIGTAGKLVARQLQRFAV